VERLSLEDSKVLVVGGAGFVGSNLVIQLLEAKVREIFVVDNLLSSISENIPINPKIKFIFGSIADQRILNQIPNDLDFIWHLACYHGNQSSIADPIADHDNNTLTSLMLFEHVSKFKNLKKVVYSAAGCAVAEKTFEKAEATQEDAPVSLFLDSPYSISKIIGELYGNYYFTQHNLPFVRARFQNVYGPREILGAGSWRGTQATVWRNVVPNFIWKALHDEPLTLENKGESSRDFIFVEDICRGLISCATYGKPGEAYNLASGIETRIVELATHIISMSESKSEIVFAPKRSWDKSGLRYGSTQKSQKQINFETQVELITGLKKTLEWTVLNKEIILQNINRHKIFLT
jgi:UDP-glucose 4-epimerase